jgi:NADH:ubiquinone oxidoreductase subunit F (NADH-binding)
VAVGGEAGLPRLLRGVGELALATLDGHLSVHGPLPDPRRRAPDQLAQDLEQSGLGGRGGASFPMARKLRAVGSRRGPKVVVANGSESEPMSRKDRVLLRELPHLVLDGAAVAARAVGAQQAILAFSKGDERSARSLERALSERWNAGLRDEPEFQLFATDNSFISGQESALINALSGEEAKPSFGSRPFERAVWGLPTLVQNVETLAHAALIARHGAGWFRQLGPSGDPGSRLVTVAGAVSAPGVYEIENGMPIVELLDLAGAEAGLAAVLVGGYFGSWLPAALLDDLPLANERLTSRGTSLGAGVIVALSSAACPVAETTRVAGYLASESAGQCGPCVNGLGAIASTLQRLASGNVHDSAHLDLERWAGELRGRGACQHPDGGARFVASALRAFAQEFRDHARHGPCERCSRHPVLPTPTVSPAAG